MAATEAALQLSTTQAQFVRDDHRYSAFVGGIGSGKSYAGAIKAMVQELGQPGLGLVCAPTFGMLRDASWRAALEVWAPILARAYRQEMRLALRTGAEVLFRSADDPDHLRGPSVRWAWLDEGALCDAETWPIVIGRLRQGGQAGRAWVTSTPRGFNWVHDVFVRDANADTALYRAATRSNPFIDERYVASLEQQYPSQFARQELQGEFITLGAGLVHREWFRLVNDAPPDLAWCRFWDLATSTKQTADYTASIRGAFDQDGTLYLADGIRGRWEWPTARRLILQQMACEPDTVVGVEQQGFQLAAVQDLLADPLTRQRTVRGVTVDRDKVSRALPWISRAEQGKVALVRGSWVAEWLAEAEAFPQGGHDDQVDATSGVVALADVPRGGVIGWV